MISTIKNSGAILILFLCFACQSTEKQPKNSTPPLLIVSFDGFRYDYLSKANTPNFDSLIANGVKAESLIPVFPSKTFPNHYSIVTGLYPENSGLVGNTMYDSKFDEWYKISKREAVTNPKWYAGEPIWNTVEKQGKKAGVFFWVGSETPIQGMRPSHWKLYDGSVPGATRIDSVAKWLTYKDDRAVDFAALYFELVDNAGHRYGPDADEVVTAVQKADSLIGYLKKKLKAEKHWDKINLIIVSDHGMTRLSKEKTILLPQLIDMNKVERIIWAPSTQIWPKKGTLDPLYQKLKAQENHYKIYKKDALPAHYHLQHRRVAPLIMVADLGYTILQKEDVPKFIKNLPSGAHGFDNHQKDMHGIFFAHGPAFKIGDTVPKFENVNIYALLAHLLKISPAPNDGSLENISEVLK